MVTPDGFGPSPLRPTRWRLPMHTPAQRGTRGTMLRMPRKDPRVDAYIAKAPDFAQPILKKIRTAVLAADKTAQEDIKWSAPTLMKDGLVCSFVGFQKHVALWFHKGALLSDPDKILISGKTIAMRAIHFTDAGQVQALQIQRLVRQAIELNTSGVHAPKRAVRSVAVPKDLSTAFTRVPRAKRSFDALAPSHRREYVQWITEAKRDETRQRRVEQAIEKLQKGERRSEKYLAPRKQASTAKNAKAKAKPKKSKSAATKASKTRAQRPAKATPAAKRKRRAAKKRSRN